jgi:uncharacterized repeat protein (TIGR01451 family)
MFLKCRQGALSGLELLLAASIIIIGCSMNGLAGDCKISITSNPGTGSYVWIQDTTTGVWLQSGTLMEPGDFLVPCSSSYTPPHYYKVYVRKPDVIYEAKNWPNSWTQSSDGAYVIGPVDGNEPLHFAGTSIAVAIDVTKTAPIGVCPPSTNFPVVSVPFTVTVTNSATSTTGATLTDFVIVDTLPPGLSFSSATPIPSSVVGNVITWTLTNYPIIPGGSFTINLNTVLAAGTSPGTLTNNVEARGATSIGTTVVKSTTSTTAVYQLPIATITKTLPV